MDGVGLEDAGTLLISTTTALEGIQVDYAMEEDRLYIYTRGAFRGSVWIWGPGVTSVSLNDAARTFRRAGEYVVLAADRLVYLPLVLRKLER